MPESKSMDQDQIEAFVNNMIQYLTKLAMDNLVVGQNLMAGSAVISDGSKQWRIYLVDRIEIVNDCPPPPKKGQYYCVIGQGPTRGHWMIAMFQFDVDDYLNTQRFDFPVPFNEEEAAIRIFDYVANGTITRNAPSYQLQ